MPTFLSSRRRLWSEAIAAAAITATIACAGEQRSACQAVEAKKTIRGTTSTFTLDASPWTVTADLDAALTVANTEKRTSCSTSVESVLTAYIGTDLIYLRSTEIASDLLLTLNASSCQQAAPPRTLDGSSETLVNEQLMAIGLCPAPTAVAAGRTRTGPTP